jgi:C4-dicarboxylate-specific signal transduction histidine kinase
MKLRIIIWTVVGILVIAAVLFLLFGGKGTQRRITLKELQLQVERTEENINELTGRLAQARAIPLSPAAVSSLNTAESLLNQARTLIENTRTSTDPKTVDQNLRTVHRLLTRSRRLIRDATRPPAAKPAGT